MIADLNKILLIFLLLFSITTRAESVTDENATPNNYHTTYGEIITEGLSDQFDQPTDINAATRWIIFIHEKATSQIFNDKLNLLKINLDEKPVLYVSDISKMPSMITKWIAIPRMKKLGYKMALDREGNITKNWPRQKESVTILEVKNQAIVSSNFLEDEEQIEAFLSQLQ